MISYLLIGLLLYPVSIYQYMKVHHKRAAEFASVEPDALMFFLAFILFTTAWPIAYPILAYNYRKEMKK